MNDPRKAARVALALGAALVACQAMASDDPSPGPLPIARDTPAFQAPEEPPGAEGESPIAAEPSGPITLDDALALALMASPDLAMFSWDVRAAEARELQAGVIPNPQLDFRLYRLAESNGQQDVPRRRIMLGQKILLGGKRQRRVDLADVEQDLAGWDYEAKRIEVATVVAARFVEVVGAQRRLEASGRFVEFLEDMGGRVSQLVDVGMIGAVDGHRVARRVGLARIDLQRAEAEHATARFRLAATWGSVEPRFSAAVGDLEEMILLPDIGTVIEIAQQSPAIARWDAEHARGEAALALAKAGRVPDLRYQVGVRWERDFSERDYIVDLRIPLPIFDRKQGDMLEAQYDMARAQAGRKMAEAESGSRIAELYHQVSASEARAVTLHEEVLPASRVTFEALYSLFEKEALDPDGVLDARRDLARAEIDLIEALVEYHQSLAILEGTIGQSLALTE